MTRKLAPALAVLAALAALAAAGPAPCAYAQEPAPGPAPAPVASGTPVQRYGVRMALEILGRAPRVGGEHCGRAGQPDEGFLAYAIVFHSADPVAGFRAAAAGTSVVAKVYALAGLEQLGAQGTAAFAELSKDFASKDRGEVETIEGCDVSNQRASKVLEDWAKRPAPRAVAPEELAVRVLAVSHSVSTPAGGEPGLGPEAEALAFSCLAKSPEGSKRFDEVVSRGNTAGRVWAVLGKKLLGDEGWKKLEGEVRAAGKGLGTVGFRDGCKVTSELSGAEALDLVLARDPASFVAQDR